MIVFVDDLNMASMDMYGTQSANALLTQIMSYWEVWRLGASTQVLPTRLLDVTFTACMNPKVGSFMVNARLQRHFTVLTTFTPDGISIAEIYSKIFDKHLENF